MEDKIIISIAFILGNITGVSTALIVQHVKRSRIRRIVEKVMDGVSAAELIRIEEGWKWDIKL